MLRISIYVMCCASAAGCTDLNHRFDSASSRLTSCGHSYIPGCFLPTLRVGGQRSIPSSLCACTWFMATSVFVRTQLPGSDTAN